MDKHVIGENAGILWRLLNQDNQRKWELQEVKKATGFDDMELAWLVRTKSSSSLINITQKLIRHTYILC